jgi:hypothetical protein
MAKLNQIIAVEKGIKSRVYGYLTEVNKLVQKPDLFNGLVKVYEKKDEDGEDLPGEKKKVQLNVPDVLRDVKLSMTELIEVTARKDFTNCQAKADVVVDGNKLIEGAPVSFLLFLEKNFTDFRTLVGNFPVLDEAESWKFDAEASLYKTDVTKTHRTKKVQKPIVLYPHSPEHPAQTQLVTEDVLAGYWNQTKMSGAISRSDKAELLDRVDKLLQAIKEAREAANIQDEVVVPKIAAKIFAWLV